MRATRDVYRVGDVAKIIGISRRQLQYWDETDLVQPGARTPGGHARYAFEDLVALKTAKRLIDAGVSVQRIRKSIRALRELLPSVERPLAEVWNDRPYQELRAAVLSEQPAPWPCQHCGARWSL